MVKMKRAATQVPQTREGFELAVVELAEAMRRAAVRAANIADGIARLKLILKAENAEDERQIKSLWAAVSAYAEAHREALLPADRKSVALAAGVLGWRTGTPKVLIEADEEELMLRLDALGFGRYLRETVELDKAALIADRDRIEGIEGVRVVQDEVLFFRPLDLEVERVLTVKGEAA
jgi:phage host-nuclease inhibitor protein Gam